MKNALTIDVEDWRQLVYWKMTGAYIAPDALAVKETRDLLEILGKHNVRATMFILDNIAETFPDLVREIDRAGHEIASHGLSHNLIYRQMPDVFREETRRAKDRLEQIIGKPVEGYRAAEFSITRASWWALEILAECGFEYDSSIYPIPGKRYGVPDFSLAPTRVQTKAGTLVEFPLTAVERWGRRFPVAGGGYLRVYPYAVTRAAIRAVNHTNRPAVVYLHPYEFAAHTLRVPDGARARNPIFFFIRYSLIHNLARGQLRARVENLLREFEFAPLKELVANVSTN